MFIVYVYVPVPVSKTSTWVHQLSRYKALGLTSKPNTGDNGVHASASPFEAMAERANWLGMCEGLYRECISSWIVGLLMESSFWQFAPYLCVA